MKLKRAPKRWFAGMALIAFAPALAAATPAAAQVARDAKHPKAVRLKIIEARYLPEKIPEKWATR